VTRIYLSMGSNLGDREANLRAGVESLRAAGEICAVSPVWATAPVGVTDQPDFLNIAVAADTSLTPRALLEAVKRIEVDVGRRPTFRRGPRVLDIDILLYGNDSVAEPDLSIPHPRLAERAFVLAPLADIAPDAVHTTFRKSVEDLLAGVSGRDSVRRIGPLGDHSS
jgi:2-amino-4-hydroxy-6-hydroxymethyldihydropteridine diphosphokinase